MSLFKVPKKEVINIETYTEDDARTVQYLLHYFQERKLIGGTSMTADTERVNSISAGVHHMRTGRIAYTAEINLEQWAG